MKQYTPKQFLIKELHGISDTNIAEHLKLYEGYVKNTNFILSELERLLEDTEKNMYTIGELRRRFSFEWNGMRNHEYYFSQFENGYQERNESHPLYLKITESFGSYEKWLRDFKTLALTRGVGWALLVYDTETSTLLNTWVDEQHLGQLATCKILLALDMWEHAFVYDYPTSEKKKYIEAFFENINWTTIESRL